MFRSDWFVSAYTIITRGPEYGPQTGHGRGTTTHPIDRLHLGQLGPGMRAREHLHDETPDTPNVGFGGIARLLDHFWSHPEGRALERGPVRLESLDES
jgi:hypothetical protein